MPKLRISFDGKHNHETWNIDQSDEIFAAMVHISLSRGDQTKNIRFETEKEMTRFKQGVALCRATDEQGMEVYLTGF